MALIKRKTRKKLSKELNKLVKRHGAEMALALVTGIISSLAADAAEKTSKREKSAKKKKSPKEPAPARTREPKRSSN